MPSNDSNLTKAERREAALQEAARLRDAQKRAAARSRYVALGALIAAIAAIAIVVAIVINNSSKTTSAAAKPLTDVTLPSTATPDGGLIVGTDGAANSKATAPVSLTVYFDFMCPICGKFEAINSDDLTRLREAGKIVVDYRPVSILDPHSQGTGYSTRAANALAVIADKDPAHVSDFIAAMFAAQPEENTAGLSDSEIISVAKSVDVSATALAALAAEPADPAKRSFSEYVSALSNRAGQDLGDSDGSWGTPTILINGVKDTTTNWTKAGELKAALESAATK